MKYRHSLRSAADRETVHDADNSLIVENEWRRKEREKERVVYSFRDVGGMLPF